MQNLLVIILAGLTYLYARKHGSYANSITFFALPVLISIIIIEYIIGYKISESGLSFLFLYFLLFAITVFVFKWLYKIKIKNPFRLKKFSINGRWLILLASALILFYLWFSRDSINKILNISYSRQEEESSALLAVVENTINIIGLMSAVIYAQTRRKFYLIPFVSVLIIGIIGASRAVIVIQAIALLTAVISSQSRAANRFGLYIVSILSIIFFLLIGALRGSFSGEEQILDVILTYMFGGLIAFDYFIKNPDPVFFSFNTAPGLLKFLNILGVDEVANNYKYVPITYPIYTNIYSSFREVISDFGYVGSIIFAVFHGYLSQKSDSWNNCFSYWRRSFAIIIMTFNFYFLFYPITMFMFVIAFLVIVPFIKIKLN
jgi:oligosaccharide repeat unit polymerase